MAIDSHIEITGFREAWVSALEEINSQPLGRSSRTPRIQSRIVNGSPFFSMPCR
jgi:hypothetical protein